MEKHGLCETGTYGKSDCQDVLSCTGSQRLKSVWWLKMSTFNPQMDQYSGAIADYGFANCNDTQDRNDLAAVYETFFGS